MRIWKVVLTIGAVSSCFLNANAQTVSGTRAGNSIILTNGVFVGQNPANVVNPQSLTPNLASSNATPAIGQPGITPAMPAPGAPAISPQGVGTAVAPQTGFTPSIGQQGFGTAIGQGNTGLGQQGSGTAIGQQGAGTAIIPETNAIVIGQPQPLSSPPVSTPSAIGVSTNLPGMFGRPALTNSGIGMTGALPRIATPALSPQGRSSTSGRR